MAERTLIAYFAYVAVIGPWFPDRKHLAYQPTELMAAVVGLLCLLAWAQNYWSSPVIRVVRDWLPLLLTIAAFREMELFLPASFTHYYEAIWARQDHTVLTVLGVRHVIEMFGKAGPLLLELSYLFTYALGPFCIAALYLGARIEQIDRFLFIYLVGTLGAYALFPYFPSEPPRIVFPQLDLPSVSTWARQFNLFILRKATIHVGVFPSAHVSSAYAACWGMFLVGLRRVGWGLLLYACAVSVATVYGRYHYFADVLAGFGVSLVAGGIGWATRHVTGSGSKSST